MRILVVDDDHALLKLITRVLRDEAYAVDTASTGEEARTLALVNDYDGIILDLQLGDRHGFEILQELRRNGRHTPILLYSGNADTDSIVRGLDAGADDYVVKPFGRQELLARIEALLRRAPESTHLQQYDDGALSIDYGRRLVVCRGLPVGLTPLEFRLLVVLVEHAGRVLSADQLVEQVWGHAAGVSRDQVKLYVSYLRKKLGQVADGFEPIETVRGFGYRYVPPSA